MTVSVSARPEALSSSRPGAAPVALAAAAYFTAHLPFLAPSLEDFDSINFALGLRDFDPARHQPHPPGSPVYIAIGRVVLPLVSSVNPALSRTEVEALTLALLSAAAGAVAVLAAFQVFAAVSAPRERAVPAWAAILLAASPLFWISGLRPMSDLPGLSVALVAQALALRGRTDHRALALAALVAALAAGLRAQTVWLTFPLLGVALFQQRRLGAAWMLTRPLAACAAGGLAWAVPLVADSGGPAQYLRALSTQAGEDFAWVNMLWLEPTLRKLAFTLYETGVLPWGQSALAGAVAVAACIGGLVMLGRERGALALLLVCFGPYTVFHLLFQETVTVRYALPTLPLVALLSARGLAIAGRRMPVLAAPLAALALAVAVPAAAAYGRQPHPAFQAIAAASREASGSRPAAVYSHQSLWRALQADAAGLPTVEPRRSYEWLGPVEYWKRGGTEPVWFLADPRRTDLALIDPQARRDVVRFRWPVADRPELGGTRPTGADWYRISTPGWFAGEGWSLTPETGGLARASATGPDHRPIHAWVRRRPGPLHLVVGGRHLGVEGDPSAELTLAIDGEIRDRWTVSVGERNFLRFVEFPDGLPTGDGPALLTVASRSPGATERRATVGIRQFDLQSADRIVYGFGEGWHEEEYDPATGLRWRWTSERSVLRIHGPPTDLEVTLRGESPRRYFDEPPLLRITSSGREIARLRPDADFEWTITVSAADMAGGEGEIAIETDRVYLPGPAEGTTDERHLGVRLYESRVAPVSP